MKKILHKLINMKCGKTSLVLVTLLVLAMLGAVFITVPNVSAYTITVDGDPSDWLADASGQTINTGMYYGNDLFDGGEYVWTDAMDDDVGDGDYEYPCNIELNPGGLNGTVDLLEWRVTANTTHLLMLFKMADVEDPWGSATGFSGIIIVILIDQDHTVGSGETEIVRNGEGDVIAEKAWEYAIVLKGWNEVWNQTGFQVTVPEIIDFDGAAYGGRTEMPQPYPGFGVMGDNVTECIEVAVPLEIIGPVCSEKWNFMIFTGHEENGGFREVQTDPCDWTPGGKGPSNFDAFDAAFYSSTAIQTADWADNILGNEVPGEGCEEIGFYNQPMGELYVGASADPDVYDPVNITGGYEPCDNFTVYVKVRNITDLWGVSFYMNYNSTVLNCTAVRYGSDWGTPLVDYLQMVGTINNTKGSIEKYDGARMAAALPTNATLYEVDFHMLDWGETVLQISGTQTELRDSAIKLIGVPTTDGYFIPEFPLAMILPLLIIVTLAAVSLRKKSQLTKQSGPSPTKH